MGTARLTVTAHVREGAAKVASMAGSHYVVIIRTVIGVSGSDLPFSIPPAATRRSVLADSLRWRYVQ